MRLKYLELQGYKTFASRTEFAFEGGITAIVGPNGSGKSNVADAIRWVLGEQSYRTLRGKRTADMIFSGSVQRARLGMASATLDLDNSDGWLPIDFSEVNITRRAYRSGENEYLLNGKRVRLRDISELFASSGLAQRTYTVIGQGLVDAVLSLRPEDRRALFEEAAGITLYRSKRSDALERMAETKSNLLRANDIINEIAPRLGRLERDAERAERQLMLGKQLEGLLRTWYGFRWRQLQLELVRSRDACARREARLERRRDALVALDGRATELRTQQAKLRETLGAWHRESSGLHRQMEEVQRDLAVWQERWSQLGKQSDEHQADLSDLETRSAITLERLEATEAEVASCHADLARKEADAAAAQTEMDTHENRRAELAGQLEDAQTGALDLAERVIEFRTQLAQLSDRGQALAREKSSHQHAISEQQAALVEIRAHAQRLSGRREALERERQERAAERNQLEAHLAQNRARQVDLENRLGEAQRSVERLQDRYDVLSRLRQEGEGFHAGVQAVLRRAGDVPRRDRETDHAPAPADAPHGSDQPPGRPSLTGILGTVGQLLQVPEGVESAIEAALGPRVQHLVTATRTDAEAALSLLREEKAGRATFLPLDAVRSPKPLEQRNEPGVVGLAAALVQADSSLGTLVDMLLGRTVVVEDLETAWLVSEALDGDYQIATLSGEVLSSTGALTGGRSDSGARNSLLAREREWRELPSRLKSAAQVSSDIETELVSAQCDAGGLQERLELLESQWHDTQASITTLREQQRQREREADQAVMQVTLREGMVQALDDEAEELEARAALLGADLDRAASEESRAREWVSSLQAQLGGMTGEELHRKLSQTRAEETVARNTWEHRRSALSTLRERLQDLDSQISAKRERLALLKEERSSLARQIEGHASQETAVRGWLAALTGRIEPAEAELATLEARRDDLSREESNLRTRLQEAQSQHAQALLTQGQQEDRLRRLREQITDDFGLVDMAPTEGLPEQPPLPLADMVSAVPAVETLPEGLEAEIRQIRAQLKRMRSVNPNAPDEYAAELERYTFLTEQAADLQDATHRLRQVISELDEVMRDEFWRTFQSVETRFKQNFTRLFGGGSTRLILTEPDDLSNTGVEIEAQPPGKRQQTLALLSGGERSLTAVSLIFALLDANPPPFCILDEVDAMLDEANVRRFRQMLSQLSERTQFIVITHNRTTIEAADTIYGVSMGEDSVSQVVSLRLGGDDIPAGERLKSQGSWI